MVPKTEKKPADPPVITLPDLIARLIEAEVPFKLLFHPEPGKDQKRFAAQVSDQVVHHDDGLTALLSALAKGIKSETDTVKEMKTHLATSEARIGRINDMLPELSAHIPAEDGSCRDCGERHTPADAVESFIAKILGAVTSGGADAPAPETEKKAKKGPN